MTLKIKQSCPLPSPREKEMPFFCKRNVFIKGLILVKLGLRQLAYFLLSDLTAIWPTWTLKPVLHLSEFPFCTETENVTSGTDSAQRN